MLEFINTIFNWSELVNIGVDASVYFVMAAIGTLLFLLKLALTMFSGFDVDYDIDADFDVDAGSFSMFSTLSIVSFIMGAGWMGLIARVGWGLDGFTSVFLSVTFGIFLMLTAAGMLWSLHKLNATPTPNPSTALGKTANTYRTIPAKGKGTGEIQVKISGVQRTVAAVTMGDEIPVWAPVKVIELRDDGVMVVEAINTSETSGEDGEDK